MHQSILDLFGLFKNRNSIRFWLIKPKLRLNNNQNEVNGTMIECILKLPLIQLTAWWFLNTAVIFWLSIFIGIEYKSTCWGGASGSLDKCNTSEFTALVKIEGNYFWKLYKSVSKKGPINRKSVLKPWPCSSLQRPQLLAAHSSIFPSCHGSSDVNWRWRQACHLLEQRNTRCMTLFPWLPPAGWMGMSIAGLGPAGTESWNPHIWLISVAYGHLIFGWWLPVVPQRLDCSEDFLLHSVLAPVTTAGAAFHRRGLSPARPGDREEMSTAHSMGTPRSYRLFQHLLSRKTLMSRYILDVHPTLIYNGCDVPIIEWISWKATVVRGLDQVPLLWYIPPLQTHPPLFFCSALQGWQLGSTSGQALCLTMGKPVLNWSRSGSFPIGFSHTLRQDLA